MKEHLAALDEFKLWGPDEWCPIVEIIDKCDSWAIASELWKILEETVNKKKMYIKHLRHATIGLEKGNCPAFQRKEQNGMCSTAGWLPHLANFSYS